MAREYDLTSVGINPAEDRAHRMRTYFIAMSVRIACVASLFFVRGWWILLVGTAAIVLPYFAVLVANQAEHRGGARPESPTPLELEGVDSDVTGGSGETATPAGADAAASEVLLIVDAPAERRARAQPADAPRPAVDPTDTTNGERA